MKPKFGIGDRVRVVNYGSPVFVHPSLQSKFEKYPRLDDYRFDMNAELVGKEGIVCKVDSPQDRPQYAIEGIPEKHAWYDEEQLEMVNPNPNVH